jgi:hypothetical protein
MTEKLDRRDDPMRDANWDYDVEPHKITAMSMTRTRATVSVETAGTTETAGNFRLPSSYIWGMCGVTGADEAPLHSCGFWEWDEDRKEKKLTEKWNSPRICVVCELKYIPIGGTTENLRGDLQQILQE